MENFLTIGQWAALIGVVIPVLVGIITKANASAALKAVTLLFLEGLNGVLVEWVATPGGFDWRGALFGAFIAWISGVAAYYGLLRHTVTLPVANATARFGLGGSQAEHFDRAA